MASDKKQRSLGGGEGANDTIKAGIEPQSMIQRGKDAGAAGVTSQISVADSAHTYNSEHDADTLSHDHLSLACLLPAQPSHEAETERERAGQGRPRRVWIALSPSGYHAKDPLPDPLTRPKPNEREPDRGYRDAEGLDRKENANCIAVSIRISCQGTGHKSI